MNITYLTHLSSQLYGTYSEHAAKNLIGYIIKNYELFGEMHVIYQSHDTVRAGMKKISQKKQDFSSTEIEGALFNKDHKTRGNLYTKVQQIIASSSISNIVLLTKKDDSLTTYFKLRLQAQGPDIVSHHV